MKKIFLFAIATSIALSSFAQKAKTNLTAKSFNGHHLAAKTTATGDTVAIEHILGTDTLAAYIVGHNADSGYVTGTDAYGDMGFAERYDHTDTLVSVIGVIARFTGTVNPASTKTVVFNTWSVGPKTLWTAAPSGHVYNSGFPNTSLTSVTVPITHLGISNIDTVADTVKSFWFPTATTNLSTFFVGYTINYTFAGLAGDTIGLWSNRDNERHIAYSSVSGADTIINNVNATQYSDNTWHDDAFDNFTLGNHLFIFPIVKIGGPNAVNGITKNNLTFHNNFPNPATTSTNIKFTVAQATEVTISISDMSGKTIQTIKGNYNAGTQVINVNTEAMAAGEYIYLVHTAEGEGFASKMSIIK